MRKRIHLLMLLLLPSAIAFCQNKVIDGKVTDDRGNALPGVSVSVSGGTTATQTKADGSFTVSVSSSAKTLSFSFVGFATQEVAIRNGGVINVTLLPQASNLGEVVVTALGVARDRRSLGYATQNIKSEEIVDKGEINLVNALQGKVAGVDITGASGSAGASANINIRGITSFNGNNQPLFIVDGIPISNDVDRSNTTTVDQQPSNRALDLNLNDIESVNVLKGPAAAALYGSRASSGAIIITTKRGTGGKGVVKVTLSSSYTRQKVSGLPEFQNDYGAGANGQYNPVSTFSWGPKFGSTPTLSNGLINAAGQVVDYRAYPDNILNFFEVAPIFDNNLNVSSGDSKQNLNFSMGNTDQKGILPNTSLNRTNVSFKFNTALTDKISVGAAVNYISAKQVGIIQGNGAQSALFQLFSVPRSFNLDFYKDNYENPDGTSNWPLNTTRDNPYYAAYKDPLTSNLTRTIGSVNLGYNITPWLNASYRLGIDVYSDRRKRIRAIGSSAYTGGLGSVMEDNFYRSELNGDLIITAKQNDFLVKGLNATLLVGQNINNKLYQNLTVQADELSIPDYYNVANGGEFSNSGETTRRQRLLGYYGQLSLSWNNYLFLELTGRADNSSTLPESKNTYFYPAVSTSFVFSDLLNIDKKVLSYAKVRLSAAKVGRDAPPYSLENVYRLWQFGNNVAQFNFPYGSLLGFSANNVIANPNLSPEFTTSYEAGINLGFWNNRITLDATYFNEVSRDQIVAVGLPYSTGYASQLTNIGEMTNKGVELMLTVTPVSTKNFKWDISANYTRLRNKVVSIAPGTKSFSITGNAFTGAIPAIVEGQPYGVLLGNKYQRSPDGQVIINVATGLPFGADAGQVIADPNRDFIAAFTNTLKYKNITLSFLFDHKQGGQILSWGIIGFRYTGALKETGVDRDQPRIFPGVIKQADGKFVPNTIQIPAQTYWTGLGQTSGAGDFGVFDATTFRLREVSASVDFSGRQLGTKVINNIRFTVFGRNLFYVAPNAPFDPEINTQGAGNIRGLELQSTPNMRSMGASLRISFN
jgi:TonB-linked SusC/RagA family outer membrane protein